MKNKFHQDRRREQEAPTRSSRGRLPDLGGLSVGQDVVAS